MLDLSSPRIMGILNITPDSFADGGAYTRLDQAIEQALRMVQEGADIIDIGGESTRPGAQAVSVWEEIDRVVPVIEALNRRVAVMLSVDTRKPEVMQAACQAGAEMINDVNALRTPGALEVARDTQAWVCLMHMQGEPQTMQQNPVYQDVVSEVRSFFSERVHACLAAGIKRERLLLDPGFGFGKTLAHNLALLRALPALHVEQLPILVGLSRKSMLGALLDNRPVHERLSASVTAALLAVQQGANIVRVHDVQATADALRIWRAVQGI